MTPQAEKFASMNAKSPVAELFLDGQGFHYKFWNGESITLNDQDVEALAVTDNESD